MIYLLGLPLGVLWMYLLRVLKKGDLKFWHYITGSGGLFVFMMVYLRPVLTQPLARMIAVLAGFPGKIFDIYSAYFKYGIIFVRSGQESISLLIDFECSGIIELLAFVSLLAFFDVYERVEKIIVGMAGVVALILGNVFRIVVICVIIHFCGTSSYYVAHAFIGRIVFYAISVVVYFYIFTRPQIVKQKVGGFQYANNQ